MLTPAAELTFLLSKKKKNVGVALMPPFGAYLVARAHIHVHLHKGYLVCIRIVRLRIRKLLEDWLYHLARPAGGACEEHDDPRDVDAAVSAAMHDWCRCARGPTRWR